MVTQMNFNFWTLDEKHEIVDHDFSLPLGPLLFDEMRVRVLEIIQKTEQKFYWDDGFSRVSLNNRNDLEAAVNWSFLSSKISGDEPEVQIWFDSERNPSGLSMAAHMRVFRSIAKAKNTPRAPIPYPLPILNMPFYAAAAAAAPESVDEAFYTDNEKDIGTVMTKAAMTRKEVVSNAKDTHSFTEWSKKVLKRCEASIEAGEAELADIRTEKEALSTAMKQLNPGYFEDANLDVAAYETYEELDCEKDIELD